MAKQITDYANEVLTEKRLKDMRDSIAGGLLTSASLAIDSKQSSEQVLAKQNTLEQRFINLQQATTDGDFNSAPEIIDARGGKATLGQRLDDTTAQLAQMATLEELKRSLGSIPYGDLKTEEGFISLPFILTRKNDGIIYHNFDFNKYKTGTELFVSSVNGDDRTGDGTEGNPYQSIYVALEDIAGRMGTNFVIKCLDVRFNRGQDVRNRSIDGKTVTIIPDNAENKIIISNHWEGLTWTEDGTGTWKSTRSGVYSVFDLTYTDGYGVPIPLTNKNSLADCQAEKGTWYTNNTDIWIHTWDDLEPTDNDHVVNVSDYCFQPTITNNGKLYIENAVILHGASNQTAVVEGNVSGLATDELVDITFIAKNCIFAGGDLRINRANAVNAVSFKKIPKVYLFDCISAYGGEDGFNYHYTGIHANNRRKCLAIEYNCSSYGHGKHSNTETANCSTAHGGVNILRINGIYYESTGPITNDADGCFSIYYDCNARDSLSTLDYQRTAFRSDNDGANIDGKMVLINCNGGGKDTYSCYSGDDMKIVLQAFRGTNFPEGLNISIVS